ncbi:ComEC/Rec2 family competence protein [Eubacterium multiforme]|uniref:Competence protein ComEC n=1 Tax=Eubacterium multiforme TaxID=83339 RepID=A0ABT9UTW1_9FIRM|nr:ComEC/Rec2 family competence protein [Eubacterium multiforme]MDQ0149739.1 competence protein ComEC [Eubacterium multiforme]
MRIFELGKVKLPIAYIAITFLFSSLYYRYFDRDFWLAIILVSLLFLWVFLKEGWQFFIFILAIFFIGILINVNYYNLRVKEYETIRVERIYSYGGVGKIDGRKIFLKGKLSGIKEGYEIVTKGKFKKDINKEKGIIGEYKIEKLKINERSIFTKLANLKNEFKRKVEENIGYRKSSLITSIVFGRDNDLGNEDEEYMKRFGIIHALSVSGLHIGLIFLIFKKIFNEKISLGFTLIYVFMTGMAFSSIRAFIMVFFSNLGFILRKRYNPIGGIAVSSIIIFFMSPYCIFNIGFLLSFGATLGILLYNKELNRKLYKLPNFLRGVVSISISAQIFTLPLLIIFFNEFSLGFIIGNIILIPLINIILIIGVFSIFIIKFSEVFDFLSFLLKIVVNILDEITEVLLDFIPEIFNINEYYAYFYIVLLLCYYLYSKGMAKAVFLPLGYIIYICIDLYSFYPKIMYKNEGSLIMSYKGDRVVIANKNVHIKELKNKTLSFRGYREFEKIKIKEDVYIKKEDKNYILTFNGTNYYLNINGLNKKDIKYDIINFKENEASEIIVLNNSLLIK